MKRNQATKIYLDYSATTPTDRAVLKKMIPYFDCKYGNPSSMHTSGRFANQVIGNCRTKISQLLNCLPSEIIFTGSGTESDNLALIGIARAYRNYGNHIIISAIEHKAVLEATSLLKNEGFDISFVSVDKDGLVNLEELKKLINDKTILISIMYANNEIGTIQPIRKISDLISEYRNKKSSEFPFFHTDACQAGGYLEINTTDLGVDLMTLNSSKIYGPKGIGILFKKESIRIKPIIVGGEQENNIRAGTESLPLMVGLTEALIISDKIRRKESERLGFLRDYFISKLKEKIPELIVNGHRVSRLPNNVHVSIPNIEGESMLLMMDKYGIEASTGSACSSYDLKPSHVLLAIGQSAEFAHGSIRFSLGRKTKKKDIDYVLSIFPNIVSRLKSISSLTIKKYEKTK